MFHPLCLPPVPDFGGCCPSILLCLCLLVCMLHVLYKKTILSCFSASVSLSVCLCPCGRLPGCCFRWKVRSPEGDLIRRVVRDETVTLAPSGPNRRGLVLMSLYSPSFCLCLSLCVINSICLPYCKDVLTEVGEVFLSPSSLCFIPRLTTCLTIAYLSFCML